MCVHYYPRIVLRPDAFAFHSAACEWHELESIGHVQRLYFAFTNVLESLYKLLIKFKPSCVFCTCPGENLCMHVIYDLVCKVDFLNEFVFFHHKLPDSSNL
jgi:hypothetical protein